MDRKPAIIALKLLVLFLFVTASGENDCNTTACCYSGLPCFTRLPPFDDLPLPEHPKVIAPSYWLYRLGEINKTLILTQIFNASLVDADNLIVLTHGFKGNMYNTPWHAFIVVELLKKRPELDVVFVDWSRGADKFVTLSGYKQAASNTRIVGAMAARFFQTSNSKFDGAKATCLGFSLGAHICGFMAKHGGFKWQRLTALDPTKPHFSKNDPSARVDKADAIFLEVIHTSSVQGLQIPIGHVDFWVNNAKHQPGCSQFFEPKKSQPPFRTQPSKLALEFNDNHAVGSFIDVIEDFFSCSHRRAPTLYYLSINLPPECDFGPFCPCSYTEKGGVNMTYYKNGTCPPDQQQWFGYKSLTTRIGSFCGKTTDKPPFYHCVKSPKRNKSWLPKKELITKMTNY